LTSAIKTVFALVLLCLLCQPSSGSASSYAVAKTAAPVLNTPGFGLIFGGTDGKTVRTDHCGQVRELEFIALPGAVFTIRAEIRDGKRTIFRVETEEYTAPTGTKLYLDSRFVDISQEKPLPRNRSLPSREAIIDSMKGAVGSPYVWGGNVQSGVAELFEMNRDSSVSTLPGTRPALAGLDCSGLLYQATAGWTPRNTSQLVAYGTAVRVSGKSVKEIAGLLEPLDLIVWNGHVLIVLDSETIIESRLECGKPGFGGVVMTPVVQRLSEIMRTRRPVDNWPATAKKKDAFVVRRWYGLK
jgi:cell wall-associated NlpC family hydrolase